MLTCTPVNILINIVKPGILNAMIPDDYALRNDFYRFVVLMGSGFVSDVFSLALITPVTYVLTQISLDGLNLGPNFDFLISAQNSFSSLFDIVMTNPMQLYTGVGIILLGKTIETALSFIITREIQKKVTKGGKDSLIFFSNMALKWIMQLVTFPFDTVWRRTMVTNGKYTGAVSSMKTGLVQGGLFDGYGWYVLRNNFLDFYQVPFGLYMMYSHGK